MLRRCPFVLGRREGTATSKHMLILHRIEGATPVTKRHILPRLRWTRAVHRRLEPRSRPHRTTPSTIDVMAVASVAGTGPGSLDVSACARGSLLGGSAPMGSRVNSVTRGSLALIPRCTHLVVAVDPGVQVRGHVTLVCGPVLVVGQPVTSVGGQGGVFALVHRSPVRCICLCGGLISKPAGCAPRASAGGHAAEHRSQRYSTSGSSGGTRSRRQSWSWSWSELTSVEKS